MSALSVQEDLTTGFITITIQHISPEFAHKLTSLIIQEINSVIKKKDVEESIKAIDFLEKGYYRQMKQSCELK